MCTLLSSGIVVPCINFEDYEDGDKDKIVFSSQAEFEEMISCLKSLQSDPLIKIWITDSNVPYFKYAFS